MTSAFVRSHSGCSPSSIIFDLDDTLIKNAQYFREAKLSLARFVCARRDYLSVAEVVDEFDRTEWMNGTARGSFGVDNFASSMIDVGTSLLNNTHDLDKFRSLALATGRHLKKVPIELIAGVQRVIETLYFRGHPMYILTKGPKEDQLRKWDELPVRHCFLGLMIGSDKTASEYLELLKRFALEPSRSFMVGNGIRTDINPAIEVGMRTIYIPNEATWRFDVCNIVSGRYAPIVLRSIVELLDLALD